MSPALDCTVVIPTYNRAPLLRETLRSLTRQDLGPERFQVVVVDDGSTDDTPEVVDSFQDRLNVEYHPLPDVGYTVCRARNVGIRNAAADVCVFIDTGVVLHSGCLAAHVACHSGERPAAVIGYVYAYTVDGRGAEKIRAAIDTDDPDGTIARFRRTGGFPDVREEFYARYTDDFADLPAPWLVYWTVNASAPTGLLREIGMFDEALRSWGGEDLDLGFRLRRAGARVTLSRQAAAVNIPHDKSFVANMRSVAANYRYLARKYDDPAMRLLATLPPEKFFRLNDILRTPGSAAAR
jgi:glycosyltransferase involved in cell wall biosynthesis